MTKSVSVPIPIGKEKISTFLSIFAGNLRNHGTFKPDSGKMFFEKGPATYQHYEQHLRGLTGLGIVPITDGGLCSFAAIDIDCHGKREIDVVKLSEKLDKLNVPALLCRSKSGGAHVYVFFKNPERVPEVRLLLSALAAKLEYPKAEVFPKQDDLWQVDGTLSDGSWINLPYFDIVHGVRYCVYGGVKLNFTSFLEKAREYRTSAEILKAALLSPDFEKPIDWTPKEEPINDEHPDAPPCIQALLMGQVPEGCRNAALYSVVIYLNKAFPAKYRELARDFNQKCLSPPLAPEELERTIKSASRREYRYKCNEEPLESLCDSATCLTKKFGIEGNDAYQVKSEVVPSASEDWGDMHHQIRIENKDGDSFTFGPLIRQATDPVRWILKINGADIIATTEQLNSYTRLDYLVQERLALCLIPLKKGEWPKALSKLMVNSITEDAPESAKVSGILRSHLDIFTVQLRTSDIEEMTDDTIVLRLAQRSPFLKFVGKELCVCFRGTDFLEYLRFAKFAMSPSDIWNVLRSIGVKRGHVKLRDESFEVLYLSTDLCRFPKQITPPEIDDEI